MAWDVAQAISLGIRAACQDADIVELPLGDGGEGTARALAHAVPGSRMVAVEVADPLGRPVQAQLALLPGGTAVVEMAAASGLGLLRPDERDPLRTSSYGTGQLISRALDLLLESGPGSSARGVDRPTLILGAGGTATVDCGMGMLAALGARFHGADGLELARFGGGALASVQRVDLSGVDPRLRRVRLILASDVTNPLLGPSGAAAVFGPQKGAGPREVNVLEAGLASFAGVVHEQTGRRIADFPGAGAAGGAGAAAVGMLGAEFRSGIELALEAVGFRRAAAGADLVITGEGRFDSQTLSGKAVAGVAAAAAELGVPVFVLAGEVEEAAEWRLPGSVVALSIAGGPLTRGESEFAAARLIAAAARRAVTMYLVGRHGRRQGAK